MPSATVDHMLIQVVGALIASVSLVLWLWIADTRRWWPFKSALAVQTVQQHRVEFEVAAAPHHHHDRRQRGERRYARRAAHTRRGLRRGARELVPAV